MTDNIINFQGYDCIVIKENYVSNNQVALSLIAANTPNNISQDVFEGMPIVKASVCIPEIELPENQTLIKDFSENKGILDALIDADIVKDLSVEYTTGHCSVSLVEILV
jgi:hypothetical protein